MMNSIAMTNKTGSPIAAPATVSVSNGTVIVQ